MQPKRGLVLTVDLNSIFNLYLKKRRFSSEKRFTFIGLSIRDPESCADEYDGAQARGEVKANGGARRFTVQSAHSELPSAADVGLTRKQIHNARQIRDAEVRDPGVVRRTLPFRENERVFHLLRLGVILVRQYGQAIHRHEISGDLRLTTALNSIFAESSGF